MPLAVTAMTGAGDDYGSPFRGPVHFTAQYPCNLTTLTTREIDTKGTLKPGVPFRLSSGSLVLVSGASQVIFGCVAEAIKVAKDNAAATIAALGTIDIAVVTIGQVNADLLEDILGSAPTADELSAFGAAGCRLVLLT